MSITTRRNVRPFTSPNAFTFAYRTDIILCMIKLFIADSGIFGDDGLFSFYLDRVDGDRRKKVMSFSDRRMKNQSLAAGVILSAALQYSGYSADIELTYNAFGKPALVSPENVFFNLSHSEGKVLCALSDKEVGCDIQKVNGANYRKIMGRFTPREQALIDGAGDNARDMFFRIWAVKESYLKALGAGFSRPLDSFGIEFSDARIKISDPEGEGAWNVWEDGSVGGYKIACCTRCDCVGLSPVCLDDEIIATSRKRFS